MKHFQVYFSKVNKEVNKEKSKPVKKQTGLLSPEMPQGKDKDTQKDAVAVIAEFVKGIRAAREGFNK